MAWASLLLPNVAILTGVVLLAGNLYRTVACRSIAAIHIADWYIPAAFLRTLALVVTAYLPWYRNGLGETVIQGY